MKNGEVQSELNNLVDVLKSVKSAKLIYGVNKNIERTERELKHLEAVRKPADRFNEFEQKRVALCVASCNKDERGEPKTVITAAGREYDIIDRPKFDSDLQALTTEYKEAIDAHRDALTRYNKLMDEENDGLRVYKIKYSVLEREQAELRVEDRLNGEQVRRIWFMIEDDIEPEAEKSQEAPKLEMLK